MVRDEDHPERALPAQKRSRERRERILEAAARVFARTGIGGATMDAIALEAGTSIGSLYRFFRDKDAIFRTLHESHFETSRRFIASFASEDLLALPWEDVIRSAIDGFFAFALSDPGFRAVWASLSFTGAMVEEGEVVNRELAVRIAPLVAKVFPRIAPAKLPTVATMIVEVVSGMTLAIARREGTERDLVLAEVKELMVRYLRPYAGDAATDTREPSPAPTGRAGSAASAPATKKRVSTRGAATSGAKKRASGRGAGGAKKRAR